MNALHKLVILLGFLALLALAISGPLYQIDVLSLGIAFTVLRWAAYVGAAMVVLNVIFYILRRPKGAMAGLAVLSLVASIITFYLPYSQYQTAKSVPPIHDITTDTTNPPEFVAIAPLRADASNPAEYAGTETAQQQLKAYPDIKTYRSPKSADELFSDALAAVEGLGWELVEANREQGRIEATDTTTWFGFKDDVVIRIQADGEQSVLDIRSKSRVGRSDVGKNAARIRLFLSKL